MAQRGYFVDANLLFLLVAGSLRTEFIERHRRLRDYSAEDYLPLTQLLDRVPKTLVTPNTLNETFNLLPYCPEHMQHPLFDRLRVMIHESEEIVVSSSVASEYPAFNRLGLTDTALIEVATGETPVVTADFGSYLEISRRNSDAVLNFHHLRSWT